MKQLNFGNVTIDRVQDWYGALLPLNVFYPTFDQAILDSQRDWLEPHFLPSKGSPNEEMLHLSLHTFIVRWVIVESTSMFATLKPGDLVLVQRWPVWTGFSRGDVVVFRDPLKDVLSMARRPLLVKRIAGMPGDKVELRHGRLFVNGRELTAETHSTQSYLVRLRDERFVDSLFAELGLPPHSLQPGRSIVEVPMNAAAVTSRRACHDEPPSVTAASSGMETTCASSQPHAWIHHRRSRR